MEIRRKRYAVMRNNRSEIWTGSVGNTRFQSVVSLNADAAIRTYPSKARAKASCKDTNAEVVLVLEAYRFPDPVKEGAND